MKLLGSLTLLLIAFAVPSVQAGNPNSAYANASLVLTGSSQNELATANATSGAGYADAMAQPGFTENSILTMGSTSRQNESVSGFSDLLTIIDPSLTGSSGSLQFHFLVSGTESFSATLPAISSIVASADFVSSGGSDNFQFTRESNGVTAGTDFLGVPETVTVPFIFGTPFTISLDIDILASVNGLGAAQTSGSFTTTASTSNVMALFEGATLPASGFSARSASGADYFTPVPEPDGLPLAGLAALLLPVISRLRRRASKSLHRPGR